MDVDKEVKRLGKKHIRTVGQSLDTYHALIEEAIKVGYEEGYSEGMIDGLEK